MNLQSSLLFLFVVVVITSASAQNELDHQDDTNCVFRPYSNNIEQISIGGRHIYTLFDEHITDNEYDIVRSIIERGGLVTEVIRDLDALIDKQGAAIQVHQDKAEAMAYLFESEQIEWIGLETSPEEFESSSIDDIDSYLRLRSSNSSIFTQLAQLTLRWNVLKTEEVLSLLFPATTAACGIHRERCKGIEQIPLEDRSLRQNFIRKLEEEDQLKNHFRVPIQRELVTQFQIQELLAMGIASVINSRTISDDVVQAFLSRLEITSTEVQSIVRAYINKVNEVVAAFIERDEHILASILSTSGHGLVVLGTWHKKGIQEGLIAACHKEHRI